MIMIKEFYSPQRALLSRTLLDGACIRPGKGKKLLHAKGRSAGSSIAVLTREVQQAITRCFQGCFSDIVFFLKLGVALSWSGCRPADPVSVPIP